MSFRHRKQTPQIWVFNSCCFADYCFSEAFLCSLNAPFERRPVRRPRVASAASWSLPAAVVAQHSVLHFLYFVIITIVVTIKPFSFYHHCTMGKLQWGDQIWICHFQDHFKDKFHLHFPMHRVLLKSPFSNNKL